MGPHGSPWLFPPTGGRNWFVFISTCSPFLSGQRRSIFQSLLRCFLGKTRPTKKKPSQVIEEGQGQGNRGLSLKSEKSMVLRSGGRGPTKENLHHMEGMGSRKAGICGPGQVIVAAFH